MTDNSSHPAQVSEPTFCPIPDDDPGKIRKVRKGPDLPGLAMPNHETFAWSCKGTLHRWNNNTERFKPYPAGNPWCRYQADDGTVHYRQKSLGKSCVSKHYVFKALPPQDGYRFGWYDPTVGINLYGNDASLIYGDTICNELQEIDRDEGGGPFYAEANLDCLKAHGVDPPELWRVNISIKNWSTGTRNAPSWSELPDFFTCSDVFQSRACVTMKH
jgi:hypothetical protein